MTRDELYDAVKLKAESFKSIETAPEFPPRKECHYNHPQLPKSNFTALKRLIDAFCPATKIDGQLILCLLLSSLWRCSPGRQPAWVIHSRDGRGVGKTTIGKICAALLGQEPLIASTKSKMDELKTRLLSSVGLQSRVVIFDNETGRVSNAQLAEMITSSVISGKQLYTGEGNRINNLLWIITLNTQTLDSDLAERCVPIQLKKPFYEPEWEQRLIDLIEKERWGIVSGA